MASIHNGPETTFNLVIQDLDAGGSPIAEENPTVAEPAAEIEVQQKDPAARRRRKTHAELAPIDEAIKSLFEPGQLVELRIPKAGKRGVVSGYFKDYEKLATQIAKHSGKAGIEGIYYTMNPVDPRLLSLIHI